MAPTVKRKASWSLKKLIAEQAVVGLLDSRGVNRYMQIMQQEPTNCFGIETASGKGVDIWQFFQDGHAASKFQSTTITIQELWRFEECVDLIILYHLKAMDPKGNIVMDYDTICNDIRKLRDLYGRKYSKDEEALVGHRKRAFHPALKSHPLLKGSVERETDILPDHIPRDPKFLTDEKVCDISHFVLHKRRDDLIELTDGDHACVKTLMEDQKYTKYVGMTYQYPERKECWTILQYSSRGPRPFSLPSGETVYSRVHRERFGFKCIRVFESVFAYNCRLVEGFIQKQYSKLPYPTEKLWRIDDWGERYCEKETDPRRPACVYLVFSKGVKPALESGELIKRDDKLQRSFYKSTRGERSSGSKQNALKKSSHKPTPVSRKTDTKHRLDSKTSSAFPMQITMEEFLRYD